MFVANWSETKSIDQRRLNVLNRGMGMRSRDNAQR